METNRNLVKCQMACDTTGQGAWCDLLEVLHTVKSLMEQKNRYWANTISRNVPCYSFKLASLISNLQVVTYGGILNLPLNNHSHLQFAVSSVESYHWTQQDGTDILPSLLYYKRHYDQAYLKTKSYNWPQCGNSLQYIWVEFWISVLQL